MVDEESELNAKRLLIFWNPFLKDCMKRRDLISTVTSSVNKKMQAMSRRGEMCEYYRRAGNKFARTIKQEY